MTFTDLPTPNHPHLVSSLISLEWTKLQSSKASTSASTGWQITPRWAWSGSRDQLLNLWAHTGKESWGKEKGVGYLSRGPQASISIMNGQLYLKWDITAAKSGHFLWNSGVCRPRLGVPLDFVYPTATPMILATPLVGRSGRERTSA